MNASESRLMEHPSKVYQPYLSACVPKPQHLRNVSKSGLIGHLIGCKVMRGTCLPAELAGGLTY